MWVDLLFVQRWNGLDENALGEKALDENALDEKALDENWAHDICGVANFDYTFTLYIIIC